jgi:guanosine-3',5'-bis(diphosphate) 3'-pyrophosphohydrolase
MNRFEHIEEYISRQVDKNMALLFSKAIKLFIKDKIDGIYSGISSTELLQGMNDVFKNRLNIRGAVFVAAALSITHRYQTDYQALSKDFSSEIAGIVEGVEKVRHVNYDKAMEQPDMQRKLVLSLARDTRSLLVLLAETLFLLRNYNQLTDIFQKLKLLNSSIAVFIPISHRLGLYSIKSEMEDLVLAHQKPEIYDGIKNKLTESEKERNKIINKFIAPLILEMNAQGLQYKIKSRLKSISSIYNKTQKQDIPLEKVYDLWAIRIILDSEPKNEKAVCWQTYSIVTNIYEPSIKRLRDWITIPKSSGYESLHTTVKDADGRWTEVQIRTTRMDEEAEKGMAAHWRYKGGKKTKGIDYWLNEIRNAIEQEPSNQEKIQIQADKFANEIYVFTPGGDLKKLKYGATVLDFAYSIHSEVGNKCTNARVNSKVVPIKQVLKSGDQVEIITSKNQKPNFDWLKWVASTRTKTKIRKALDEQKTLEIKKGKEILERKFKNWKIELSQEVIDNLIEKLNLKEHYDLFWNISKEKIDPLYLKKLLTADNEEVDIEEIDKSTLGVEDVSWERHHKDVLIIENIDNVNFNLARCCNPIHGDKIFGFVTVSKGITIHRNNCPNAKEMKKKFPYRIISAKWKQGKSRVNFKTAISIFGTNKMGLASQITQVISNEMKVDILSINFDTKNALFEGKIWLLVQDSSHLDMLLEKLRSLNGINQVFRMDS